MAMIRELPENWPLAEAAKRLFPKVWEQQFTKLPEWNNLKQGCVITFIPPLSISRLNQIDLVEEEWPLTTEMG